jgi:ABC-type amino acid transport substrate-binding protein
MLLVERAHDAGSLLGERLPTPDFDMNTTLGRIQKSGVMRVGVVADAPGFSSRNPYTERFEGIDVALARKLAQHVFGGTMFTANRNVELVEVGLPARASALVEHQVDIVASVFAPTPERRQLVDFTDPYYGSPIGILAPEDLNLESIDGLSRLRVARTASTVEAHIIAERKLAASVIETSSNVEAVQAVASGRADVALMSAVLMDKFVHEVPGLKRLPIGLDSFPFAIGLPKGDDVSLEFLNVQINELVRQGYMSLADVVRRRND